MNTIAKIVANICDDEVFSVNDPEIENSISTQELSKVVSKFVLRARQGRTCMYRFDNDGKHIFMNPNTKTITWNDGVTGLSSTLCMTTGDDEDDARMILDMIEEAFYLCYNGE